MKDCVTLKRRLSLTGRMNTCIAVIWFHEWTIWLLNPSLISPVLMVNIFSGSYICLQIPTCRDKQNNQIKDFTIIFVCLSIILNTFFKLDTIKIAVEISKLSIDMFQVTGLFALNNKTIFGNITIYMYINIYVYVLCIYQDHMMRLCLSLMLMDATEVKRCNVIC